MKFARWSFLIAEIWRILVLPPLYFLENRIGIDHPPAITHPEYYYGFVGVAQVLFLVIARDLERFRKAMLPAMIENFSFVIAVYSLYVSRHVGSNIVGAASMDLALGVLFVVSFFRTGEAARAPM